MKVSTSATLVLVVSLLQQNPPGSLAFVVSSSNNKKSKRNYGQLACGQSLDPEHAASSPVWTSRRGMLTSTAVATLAPYLLPLRAHAQPNDEESSSSWMADPSELVSKRTAKLLRRQAEEAASRVTPQNRQDYQTFGVTKVTKVVSDQWLETLRNGCELAQDQAGPFAEYLQQPTDSGIFFTDLEMARRLPLFAAFSLHGPAAAVAGTVMGSTQVRYLYDQLFVKEQGVSTHTPWHQDGGYWRVKGDQVCSVFVPLDPVEPEQGLQFVARSHTWPLHNPHHFADGTPYRGTSLPPMPDITAMAQQRDGSTIDLQTFALQPGDVLVFSAKTVHGGPGNWGRALSTRWVGDGATFWDRPGEGAVPTLDVNLRDGDLLSQNTAAFPTSWQK